MGTQVLIPGCTGHPFLPRVGIQSLKALSALSSAAALGLCSENFQTILPSSCTNLYSHQWYTRIPFSLHLGEYLIFLVFLVTAILTGVRRDLLVVLPVFPWLAILNTYWSFVRFFFFFEKNVYSGPWSLLRSGCLGLFLLLSSTNLSIFPICFSSEILLLNWHLWGFSLPCFPHCLVFLFTALFSSKQSSSCLRDYFERGFPYSPVTVEGNVTNGTSITPMRRVRLGSPGQVQEARVFRMSLPEAAWSCQLPEKNWGSVSEPHRTGL